MILAILGTLDVVAGISLLFLKTFPANFLFYIGLLVLLKAIYSVATGILSKCFFDFLGWIDLIVGIALIFSFSIPYLWLAPVIKGIYSMVVGI